MDNESEQTVNHDDNPQLDPNQNTHQPFIQPQSDQPFDQPQVALGNNQNPVGNKKSNKKLTVVLLLILLLLVAAGGIFYEIKHHKKPAPKVVVTVTTTKKPTTQTVQIVTDTWTGAGTNSNWSTASNWSNGVPKANYGLIFNLAPNTSSGQLSTNNDLTGLSVNNIVFEGGTANAHGSEEISLTGNPISLANGIADKTASDVSSSIAFNVSLTANQTFNLNGNFGFVPVSSTNLASTDVNLSTYKLTVTGSNGASFNYISGSGSLIFNPTNGASAVTGIGQASPNFSGQVDIEGGIFALTYGNSFGTATLNVNSGGTLRIVSNSTTATPLSNNIKLAGKGNSDSSGNYFGAINVVGSNQNITLSGIITLSADTQLGIYDASTNNPGGGTGTFTLTQAPILNGYTLTGVTTNTKVATK